MLSWRYFAAMAASGISFTQTFEVFIDVVRYLLKKEQEKVMMRYERK
jgi:hypothetical protein